MTKNDYIILFVIMTIYSVFALRDLGDMDAPQTFWENKKDNVIRIELKEKENISKIAYYNGFHEECEYDVRLSTKGFGKWEYKRNWTS